MLALGLSNILMTFFAFPFLIFIYLNYRFYKLTKNKDYLFSSSLLVIGAAFLFLAEFYPIVKAEFLTLSNQLKYIFLLSITNIFFLFASIYFYLSFLLYPIPLKFKVKFYIPTSISLAIIGYLLTYLLPYPFLLSFSLVCFPLSTLIIASAFIVISYILSLFSKEEMLYTIASAFLLLNSAIYSIFSYKSIQLNLFSLSISFNTISYIFGILGASIASFSTTSLLYRVLKRAEIEVSLRDKSIDKMLRRLYSNLSNYIGSSVHGIFKLAIEDFETIKGKKVLVKNGKIINLSKSEKLELISLFIKNLEKIIGKDVVKRLIKDKDKTYKKVLEKAKEIEKYKNRIENLKRIFAKRVRKRRKK